MREEPNTTYGTSFDPYQTRIYINDDGHYATAGGGDSYGADTEDYDLPTSFITSKRGGRVTEISEAADEAPEFFGEFFSKHREAPKVTYTEIPMTKKRPSLGEEYAGAYSTSLYMDAPLRTEGDSPEKKELYGAAEDSADSFFANNNDNGF